jgi:signal-transduction protein with cAMP-binding, CBS, and nucleotidyltransferase domain
MKRSHWGDKGSPGPEHDSGVVHVEELMHTPVMTVTRHQSVGHARELMAQHGVHSLPVVGPEDEAVGILTTADLIDGVADETLIGNVMTRDVLTVARYAGPHQAARAMRNAKIHHLVVTHEHKVVGILSSFDLLRLVEDRRFVAKGLARGPRKASWEKRKRRAEDGEPSAPVAED